MLDVYKIKELRAANFRASASGFTDACHSNTGSRKKEKENPPGLTKTLSRNTHRRVFLRHFHILGCTLGVVNHGDIEGRCGRLYISTGRKLYD